MKLTPWKPKTNDPFNDVFDFDSPHWGLSLLPRLEKNLAFSRNGFCPSVDVIDEKNQIKVKADIPGLNKEDIQLNSEGSLLIIRGERKTEEEKKDQRYYHVERSYGFFERSVDVGVVIDQSKVSAKYKNGVLEVVIPKIEGKIKQQIAIDG